MDGSYRSHGPYPGGTAPPGGGSMGYAASSYGGDFYPEDDTYNNYSDAPADRADILKLVLYDLNSAIAPREIRLMAIHAALEEFDHDDEPWHDEELELRADHILLQKLTYALSVDPRGLEVGYVLAAMEAVYRAGRTRLAQSFHEVCDALLPLFVEMIAPPAGWRPAVAAGTGGASVGASEAVGGEGTSVGRRESDVANGRRGSNGSKYGDFFVEETSAFQQRTTYGDYDEESAESVEIPSQPASEFFDNMARGSAASSSRASQGGDGTISPVTSAEGLTECVDDSNRVPSEFGRSIPAGTDAYFEEMKRRKSTDSGAPSGGAEGGRPQGSNLRSNDGNTLVPQPVHLGDANDRALVPHQAPPGQYSAQSIPQTQGAIDNERIRMELQAAREAMQAQPTSGPPLLGNPLAIEGGAADEGEGVMPLRGGGGEEEDGEEEFGSTFRDMVLHEGSSAPGSTVEEAEDNPFSDSSSFKGYGGGSSIGGYSGAFGDGKTAGENEGVDVQDNPFSDSSSFRASSHAGSSHYGSESGLFGGDRGRNRRRTIESESTGATPRQFNTSVNKRPQDAPAPPTSDSDQRGAAGFDEQGGFSGAAPQVFAGFDDEDEDEPGRRASINSESKYSGSGGSGLHDDGQEQRKTSAAQGEFDEHGGYSGAAPAVFPGYHDEANEGLKQSFGNSANSESKFDQSDRSGPYFDQSYRSGRSYPFSEYTGMEGDPSQYDPSQYDPSQYSPGRSSRHPGTGYTEASSYADDPNSRRQSEYTEGSGYADDPNSRRQSDITDEWDDSMRSGLGESLPPEPQSYVGKPQSRDEAKYSDLEGASHHHHHGTQDEDIFQFKGPRLATTSEDYFSYSDPVDGEVCPLGVRKVLKILRYFSRVLSAMEPLAQQPGLVDALLYHMTRKPRSDDYEDEIASRVDAIAVVVNLACAEENKIMLVYHEGLLDAVINIANHDPIDEAREHAAIVLMNLAYAEENKVHMVNQHHLLDTLVHLLSDVSPFTRRYASAALFTLACTYANTAVMARHCDGGILEALRKVLLNDPIDEARVNAAEALFNLARNNSDDTVENMGNHPRLLASLAHSVLTDYSADVRAYSARALEWLSADIHHPMQCHRILLKALVVASQWTKTTCIAEALKLQASLSENRKAMAEHPGLLDALATLALLDGITDDEVKTCAISAIERLSKEPSTRHIIAKHEGVMTALAKATFAKDGVEDEAPDDGTPTALLMRTALKNLAEVL